MTDDLWPGRAAEAKRLGIRIEQIGDATLILGDAREIVPSLGQVAVVATDPPFGMSFQSNHRLIQHSEIANDNNTDLLLFASQIPVSHSRYVFCRWDNLADIPKPKSLVTWVKNNWSMGDLDHEHARQTEVIAFYPGTEHFFPLGRPQDVIRAPRTGNDNHPTEKPVGLMMAILEWTTGLVLDPFMGSGTTLVAANRLGRPSIGIEIDPTHFETACRRVEAGAKQPDMFIKQPEQPRQDAMSFD